MATFYQKSSEALFKLIRVSSLNIHTRAFLTYSPPSSLLISFPSRFGPRTLPPISLFHTLHCLKLHRKCLQNNRMDQDVAGLLAPQRVAVGIMGELCIFWYQDATEFWLRSLHVGMDSSGFLGGNLPLHLLSLL